MIVRISHPEHPNAVRTIVLVLALAATVTLVPLWAPLVLAAWFAALSQPLLSRFAGWLRGRHRAAAVLVVLLLLVLLVPIVLMTISLVGSATELAQKIAASKDGGNALRALVSNGNGADVDPRAMLKAPEKMMGLAREHGARAWTILQMVAGAATSAVIGTFVFALGAYTFLVDGKRAYAWARRHSPIDPEHLDRMAEAFNETGRGLLIGVVLTGAVQAGIATICYVALGVPRALMLGLLTFFASLIPSFGTGLVWAPVAAGLALSGRTGAAIALFVVGAGVVSLVDNFLRPIFARYGKLDLPTFVLLIAMFGGLAIFGGWGLMLGPLVLRLFVEALRIARETKLTGAHLEHSESRP